MFNVQLFQQIQCYQNYIRSFFFFGLKKSIFINTFTIYHNHLHTHTLILTHRAEHKHFFLYSQWLCLALGIPLRWSDGKTVFLTAFISFHSYSHLCFTRLFIHHLLSLSMSLSHFINNVIRYVVFVSKIQFQPKTKLSHIFIASTPLDAMRFLYHFIDTIFTVKHKKNRNIPPKINEKVMFNVMQRFLFAYISHCYFFQHSPIGWIWNINAWYCVDSHSFHLFLIHIDK